MLALTLLVAALAASASATGYVDGREYVYKYVSHFYSGFPRIKDQFSGYTFKAHIHIQPHGDYALVKLTDQKIAPFNEEVEDIRYHQFDYKPMPESMDSYAQTFKVYRKNGIVTHFEVPKGQSPFIVNARRGLIALFNLNFDEAEAQPSTEDNDLSRPDPDRHYYKVYEKGVLGDCETAYVIGHHPHEHSPHNNIVLNVTKVRNYHKCRTTPSHVYGTFHGHECGQAEHEKAHTLHGDAQFRYDIRGYRHHYVIEKIVTVGEVAYTPYPIEGQTVTAKNKRYMKLVDEGPVSTPFEMPAETDSYDSLEYSFEQHKEFKDPVDMKKPHYLYHVYGYKVPFETIKGQFDELVQPYNDDTYQQHLKDKDFPAKFIELMKSAGTMGYDDIDALYKAIADVPKSGATQEQKLYRHLFVDALVHLGTNPAALFAKFLIENKKATPSEALHFFYTFQRHVKEVSETLLDEMQSLCFHDSVKKHTNVHEACLMAFSNIISDHCIKRLHPELPQDTYKHCQPEDAIKYFDTIAKHYKETTDDKLKAIYMKAAGNIGLREIIPYVKPYIEGAVGSHNKFMRRVAIWGIRNVGFRFPEKVKELLVPLLFNQTENYEFRLAAYIMLMMYNPSLYELEGVARGLKFEPDDQVKSYIYSSFKHLANSTHPCHRKISKDVHYALRIMDDHHHDYDQYDYSFSQDHIVGGYDGDYDFGGLTRLSYFASDTGYVPRSFYYGMDDFIGGKNFQTFAVGFSQHGIEKFLDKIFGPEGSFGRRSIFDLFKKRGKRDAGGVEKELNEIKSKINIPVHEYEPLQGEIFFKYMGNYLSSFHFDEKTFEQFFTEGRFTIPNLPNMYKKVGAFYYQRFMLPLDQMYVIPSESGVPLVFDYKQANYFYHKNKESSFKVEPGFFAEERGGKFPDHVKAETDGHIGCDKNLFASVGFVMPFDKRTSGAGINRRATLSLPLKLKLDLDVKEKQLSFKWTPVAPHQVYHFHYEPYTFADRFDNTLPPCQEEMYRPVKRLSGKNMQESFMHDTFGVGFDVSAYYENPFNTKGDWLSFFFEKDYREKFYYMYANPHFEPYNVDIQFSHAATGATKEVETTFKYKYFHTEHSEPEFATEGFQDYKISEGSDRKPYCTCALEYEMVAKGDKERKSHAAISWTRDLKRSHHKINFYYNRTPFHPSETQNLKVCGSSFLKYPEYDYMKIAHMDTIGMDHTVMSEMKVHFGKDCNSHQKLHVEGHFKTTDEQREHEAKREVPDTPEHYNPYAHLYQACMKERQAHVMFGHHCLDYFRLISTVHGYDFHAKFENLSPRFMFYTHKVGGLLRHMMYEHAAYDINAKNPAGEYHLHANFSLHLPVVDMHITNPIVSAHVKNFYVPMYRGLRSFPTFEDMHIKNSISEIHCKLEGDHVETYDKYEYNLPPIDCWKLISKDCSPNEFFTVLGTKITHPTYKKAVKIFIGQHKVEALPVSDESGIIIRVDGTAVPVTVTEPYMHYEGGHEAGHQHGPDFYITQRGFYYALHSEKYGLIVEYDGINIVVQVSPFYRNKVCGLCGNYNGQKHDRITNADGCYYEDHAAFAYSFSIPSDTCQVPKFEPKCPAEGGFGCTKLRTKLTDKGSETCFSTEPVAECASHCKARSTTSKTLSFHCLPAKDDSTKALVRQQAHRVIHEVRRKSKDHEATVEVPDECLKV